MGNSATFHVGVVASPDPNAVFVQWQKNSVDIPGATDVERMGVHRAPVVVTAPRSASAAAYRELWSEACKRLGLTGSV